MSLMFLVRMLKGSLPGFPRSDGVRTPFLPDFFKEKIQVSYSALASGLFVRKYEGPTFCLSGKSRDGSTRFSQTKGSEAARGLAEVLSRQDYLMNLNGPRQKCRGFFMYQRNIIDEKQKTLKKIDLRLSLFLIYVII